MIGTQFLYSTSFRVSFYLLEFTLCFLKNENTFTVKKKLFEFLRIGIRMVGSDLDPSKRSDLQHCS